MFICWFYFEPILVQFGFYVCSIWALFGFLIGLDVWLDLGLDLGFDWGLIFVLFGFYVVSSWFPVWVLFGFYVCSILMLA